MFEIIVARKVLNFSDGVQYRRIHPYWDKKALDKMPYIMQGFVKKPADVAKGIDFDRKLYIARRVF